MPLEPKSKARPQIKLTFELGGLPGKNYGDLFRSFEFRGMVNGGYIVRAKLFDAHYNLLSRLIEEGYFKETRTKPVQITFQILQGPDGTYPETATRTQTAILISLDTVGGPADVGNLEFIAIDPPSWYLNCGDAGGDCYKGRVDQVIQKVVSDYAPGINLEIGRTTDSEFNKWWLLRQDPKTFISSLTDWSAAITQKQTQWMIQMDGTRLIIKEQASLPSKQRAFYRYFTSGANDTIQEVSLKADNALSIVQQALVTAGSAAVSGHYLDKITDSKQKKVFTKDSNTSNKQIVRVTDDQSFTKPVDSIGNKAAGWSSVTSIPEIYSAGDLGINFQDYIDGRGRAMWLNMTNALLRAKFRVLGHGEWSSTEGLGVDTIFIKWTAGKRDGGEDFWWTTGNWLVYGFHHIVTMQEWLTDLYCSRFDYDAEGKKVGGGGR
jgi:hypothetical protein